MNPLAAILVLVTSGVLFAQADTNDPTDTPTVRALTALLPLRDQALHGEWLRHQASEAQFAEWLSRQNESSEFARWVAAQSQQSAFAGWLMAQKQSAGKGVFASCLGSPDLLLGVRSSYARPNYGGNAFEAVRRNLWLQVARGEALPR
jgi:hypothetical protein